MCIYKKYIQKKFLFKVLLTQDEPLNAAQAAPLNAAHHFASQYLAQAAASAQIAAATTAAAQAASNAVTAF